MSRAFPVRRRTARCDPAELRDRRELRRRQLIRQAVEEIGHGATREEVARRTGIPLGYLAWAYPTVEDLRRERA